MAPSKTAVKVDTEKQQGSQVLLTVEVPVADVTSAVERALARLAARSRIPGFRPGKAPHAVVERQLGWPAVREEALELLLASAYSAALETGAVEPVDQPRVEIVQFERGQPFRFKATVPVKPAVELGDYASIRVAKTKTEVTPEQVAEALERLRDRFSELQVVTEGAVQENDFLTIDLQMLERGVPVLGESRTGSELHVAREHLLPGLTDALIGAAVGDTREAVVTLPDDYAKKELAGKPVLYRMTVRGIKRKVLPPVEELPKLLGRDGTLEDVRADVLKDLEEVAARQNEQRFESEVLRQLSEGAKIDVPAALVEREIDRELRDFELRLGTQGIKLDRFLSYTNQTPEVLRAERRPLAESKVRLELALEALAAKEQIKVTPEDVQQSVQMALAEEGGNNAERRRELARSEAMHQYFERQLTLRKAAEFIGTLAASEPSDTMGAPSSSG
jgi:trigger factor